jgi:hypothetical protein
VLTLPFVFYNPDEFDNPPFTLQADEIDICGKLDVRESLLVINIFPINPNATDDE